MKILSKIENANDIPSKEFVDQKIVGLTEQQYEQLEEKKKKECSIVYMKRNNKCCI